MLAPCRLAWGPTQGSDFVGAATEPEKGGRPRVNSVLGLNCWFQRGTPALTSKGCVLKQTGCKTLPQGCTRLSSWCWASSWWCTLLTCDPSFSSSSWKEMARGPQNLKKHFPEGFELPSMHGCTSCNTWKTALDVPRASQPGGLPRHPGHRPSRSRVDSSAT